LKNIILAISLLLIWANHALSFDFLRAEKAKYEVRYLTLPVVRVSMESTPITEPDSGSYRIYITARTTKFWSMFYPIDNFYWTYLDTIGLPLIYRRNINEKSLKKQSSEQFDHRFNRIYYEGDTAIDHPGDLENFFSALYRLRTAPLYLGMADSFYINVEKASWIARWTVEGIKDIKAGGKQISCYQIDVKFTSKLQDTKRLPTDALSLNLVSEDTILKIYISKDDWRLPINVEYQLTPFDVEAIITEFPKGYLEPENR